MQAFVSPVQTAVSAPRTLLSTLYTQLCTTPGQLPPLQASLPRRRTLLSEL